MQSVDQTEAAAEAQIDDNDLEEFSESSKTGHPSKTSHPKSNEDILIDMIYQMRQEMDEMHREKDVMRREMDSMRHKLESCNKSQHYWIGLLARHRQHHRTALRRLHRASSQTPPSRLKRKRC